MATQAPIVPPAFPSKEASIPGIFLPPSFVIHSQDRNLKGLPPLDDPPTVPLGVLANFAGTFVGTGFNTIFRPNNEPTTTRFNVAVNPPPPQGANENVLELNLTTETLTFTGDIGSVPNRGLFKQGNIFLNGVPYVQAVKAVTNLDNGKADGKARDIHLEPGLWMRVPASTTNPVLGETLNRMGCIPHGTTINAQGLAPTAPTTGPPKILPVGITPFDIGQPNSTHTFDSQDVTKTVTPRLPQDLTKFIKAGTITQAILTDPNTVLRNAIAGQNITKTSTFTVSTAPIAPKHTGGTANIAFLQGSSDVGPNANVPFMSSTFWVEEVQHSLEVPVWKPGQPPLTIRAPMPNQNPQTPAQPQFVFTPPKEITALKKITVTTTQIQYSQMVLLDFNGLSWPHVSVATLVQGGDLSVPASAFN